jgi:hypothetical protein
MTRLLASSLEAVNVFNTVLLPHLGRSNTRRAWRTAVHGPIAEVSLWG